MSRLAQNLRACRGSVRLTGILLLAAVFGSALVWIGRAGADEGGEPAGALAAVSNVATGRADAVDAADFPCTTSFSFVAMPGMSKTFAFGGDASRPVLVLFQGEWRVGIDGFAVIRLVIDGVVQPGPGAGVDVHENDSETDVETNGFNFISAPLAPGTHTATIEWRRLAGTICVEQRSLIVLHK